jgi:hypothetical protein
MELHHGFGGNHFFVFSRALDLEVHGREFALVWKQGRQNDGLSLLEVVALLLFRVQLKHDGDVSSVERKSFFDCLSYRVLLCCLIALEAPHLGVGFRQVFVGVPITVLEALDSSILLETDSCICEGSVDLIGEVHVFSCPLLKSGVLCVFLANCVVFGVILEVFELLVEINGFVAIVRDLCSVRVVSVLTAHSLDLHFVEKVGELRGIGLLGDFEAAHKL